MGVEHHEIVVLCAPFTDEKRALFHGDVRRLKAEMPERFARLVVGPIASAMNGFEWWAMFPDGSKHFWQDSVEGNQWRLRFLALTPDGYSYHHFSWGEQGDAVVTDAIESYEIEREEAKDV